MIGSAMDRAMLLRHLAEAERHVAEGDRHLGRQREIIVQTEAAGRDSQLARDVLATMELSQASHISGRARVIRELEQLPT